MLTSLSPEMGRSARGVLFPTGAIAKYGIGVRTRPGTAVSSEIVIKSLLPLSSSFSSASHWRIEAEQSLSRKDDSVV